MSLCGVWCVLNTVLCSCAPVSAFVSNKQNMRDVAVVRMRMRCEIKDISIVKTSSACACACVDSCRAHCLLTLRSKCYKVLLGISYYSHFTYSHLSRSAHAAHTMCVMCFSIMLTLVLILLKGNVIRAMP